MIIKLNFYLVVLVRILKLFWFLCFMTLKIIFLGFFADIYWNIYQWSFFSSIHCVTLFLRQIFYHKNDNVKANVCLFIAIILYSIDYTRLEGKLFH